MSPASQRQIAFAREQRHNIADSERRLWAALRSRRFGEQKFRRQVPIGPFIADFACKSARLVIEVDGGAHAPDAALQRDERRTRWLESQGWEVIRFWTEDLIDMRSVLDSIDLALSVAAERGKPSPGAARHPLPLSRERDWPSPGAARHPLPLSRERD